MQTPQTTPKTKTNYTFNKNIIYPSWRLQKFYKIVNKKGETVNFKANPIQQRLNKVKANKKIILKARQFGITTNEVLKMLDFCLWNKNRVACILSHEQDSIKKIFQIVKFAHANMPEMFRMELDRGGGSRYEYRFPDSGSKIYCDLASRGDTIHWLHISEAAHVKDPDKIRATMQTVPLSGRITLESTPAGLGNWFYDLWCESNSEYEKIFFPWFIHEEYQIDQRIKLIPTEEELDFMTKAKASFAIDITDGQLAFRRSKQKELKHIFRQEYPEDDQSCFLASGNAAINSESILNMKIKAKTPIKETSTFKLFKEPSRSRRYIFGVDVAEGYDGDYSVIQIFDVQDMEQVAIYRAHVKPYELANKIIELSEMFTSSLNRRPLVAVERNNHGHGTLQELYEHHQYPNLFRDKDDKLGWLTDKISRPLMMDAFIDAIENQRIILNDEITFQECLTLVELDGRIEAGKGKHDDTVTAGAVALQLCIKESSALFYENIGKMIKI